MKKTPSYLKGLAEDRARAAGVVRVGPDNHGGFNRA
jgi:hypothetical protein